MATTEAERRLAHRAGRLAARTGRPLATACPYLPGQGGRQLVLALWFVRGFRSWQTAR
jgi:hypothetical protein